MAWSPQSRRKLQAKKQKGKSFLSKNKKFTAILLLICLAALGGVHFFMWQLHEKTCAVSCADPTVGCFNPIGYLAVFGPCTGYFNAKTNQTQVGIH